MKEAAGYYCEEKKVESFEESIALNEIVSKEGSKRCLGQNKSLPSPPLLLVPPLAATTKRNEKSRRLFWTLLRTILCDIPMMTVLLAYFSLLWLSHVHSNYLEEQLRAMHFSDERRAEEITYYTRACSGQDITAKSGAELFLSEDATVDEAYQHQLKHGFTVFPKVLSDETATALREHVVERNTFDATDSESIFVIENDKRYSFGLETSYPVVAKAMMEIANHELLRPALEKIIGKNPALIEMTAITSSYGAAHQYWHDDVIPTASAIRYARTFGPSYSVFVQLQNTTKAMGATDACPGTHYCSAPGVDSVCEEYGFQMVGDQGYWHTGDALLMNMNSYHRGTAHTDPHAPDRVMLILTFTTRPRSRAESRQLSQGITFSLRWDEWGHTLDDMSKADKIMQRPWTFLRALGLFKLPGTDWGIDYITSGSMRMSNEDNGFREDEFEEFINQGGIWWVPTFLQGRVEDDDDDSWYEYYVDTGERCLDFIQSKLLPTCATLYLVLAAFLSLLSREGRFAVFRNTIVRLSFMAVFAFTLYRLAVHRVDGTDWARDIRAKKSHRGVFKSQEAFGIVSQGPATLPNRLDVLIENRYGSEFLAMYDDFIEGHPGNRMFGDYVREAAQVYGQYPESLKNETAYYVVQAVKDNHGRFLYQGPTGAWEWLSDDKSVAHVRRQLASSSRLIKKVLTRKIRHLISERMYGVHRDTAMAQKHAVPYLQRLQTRIIGDTSKSHALPFKENGIFLSLIRMPILRSLSNRMVADEAARSPFPPKWEVREPELGAWLTVGDSVECLEDDGFWYPAIIRHITAHGEYHIHWAAGMSGVSEIGYVRPFDGYKEGQLVEIYDEENDEQVESTVLRVNDNGTYDLESDDDGYLYRGVRLGILRRHAEKSDSNVATYKAAY